MTQSFFVFAASVLAALHLTTSATQAAVSVIDEGLDNSGLNSTLSTSTNAAKGINFVMGSGADYTLSDVVLGLGAITGSPTFQVEVWSDDGTGAPIGTLLETLTNPVSLAPNSTNTFTSSGITLAADTTYWLVARVTNAGSSVVWLGNNADTSVTSDIGATHTARLFGPSSNPGSWTGASSVLNQIQINAIPEPSVALLGGLGLLCLLRRRRN